VDVIEKRKIGKYEITGVLGRGGMGVVYLAEDKRIRRPVAIKTLTEGFSGQPDMLERFYREAQTGILQHPNIVIVYDLGDEDGMPFIVMEYVDGDPLDKLIASGRQISLVEKLSIIEQVCLALGYAHQRGVIHRDVKPANVIVRHDGLAKIVDFGIARMQSSGPESGLTQTGNVIGTIHYIAPERLKGLPFDGRSDIFSTGVMLYYLLTGQLPFTGEDMTVLQKLVNDPHPPLSTYLANYPPALDTIVDRALAKDPERRYGTAEEFASDLHALGEELKKGQITELFGDAERLTAEQQFGRAREVLLQLVRIDPQHTGARQLLGVVQQNLALLQRAEQVRHLIAEAAEAAAASRFNEALNSLDQALKLDPENADVKQRLESVKESKRRYDELNTLVSQAESLRERGDWTGALNLAEKALALDQQDSKVRALHAEILRQVKLVAQQNQIRELMGKARLEVSSRHFTSAIEILREASKIDPSLPEIESLMQTAVSGQEQERRRKLIEQIHAEIEKCLVAEQYDRASELVERAVEQLPTESSLLQLKTRVVLVTREHRRKQIVDTTATKAQEMSQQSPGEALLIVQKALQELPGEERLLALEDSLRQRLKALESEEVRGRYLREAQQAIGRNEFDKAVAILESYQLEFADAAGVGELMEYAKHELAQQQRRTRIATTVTKARELLLEERFDQTIQLLEPAVSETADPTLSRLLDEARTQREALLRKSEAVLGQISRHRERGQFDEAINLLLALPSTNAAGSPQNALLAEIRAEKTRKETTESALAAAATASELGSFQAAIESLQKVQRAWGDTPQLSKAVAGVESRRAQRANDAVAKSVEEARAALLDNDPAAAVAALKSSAEWFEFAGAAQQADWKRLNTEAAKPVTRKTAGRVPAVNVPGAVKEAAPRNKLLIPLIAGGVAIVLLAVIAVFLFRGKQAPPQPQPFPVPQEQGESTGTLLVKGNAEEIEIDVDKPTNTKGFTLPDGTASISLDPGEHKIFLSKAGYTECPPVTVTIKAGEQAQVQCQMTKIPGQVTPTPTDAWLTIHSQPNAAVSIDSVPQGNVDAHGTLIVHIVQVKPGSHTLQLSLNGYQNSIQEFAITAGEKKDFTVLLSPVVVVTHAPPTVIFSSSSPTVEEGNSVTLTWRTANASQVSINNGVGGVSANGDKTVSPEKDTTYVLTATGDGGTQTQQVSITVIPKAPPQPQPQQQQPPPPQPPPQPSDQSLVQTVVTSFSAALSAHDVARMQAVWPTMPPKDMKRWNDLFKDKSTSKAKITQSCPPSGLSITGDTASWSCTITILIPGGAPPTSQSQRFALAKKNGNWVVTDWR
jgi:tetratricopeptide (TPR) repeat protein/predicted Ser/Thr protein kinase